MTTRRIVFAGIGKMGLPMARHLRAAGHHVVAADPSAERRALAASAGITAAESIGEALSSGEGGCDILVSSLPDDAALLATAVAIAEAARAGLLSPGATWIDTSTVSADASREACARAAGAGIACVRAPVSGNATMAERAQLTVFASGERAACDACADVFGCWGPQWLWVGSSDEARIAKLAVNLLIVGTSTMLAEALALGERGGLERETLWRVIESSAVASPIVKAKAPALRADDYTPTFTVEQMRKDVALIRDAARSHGVETPVADAASHALDRAVARGEGGEDYAVVIRDARDTRAGP